MYILSILLATSLSLVNSVFLVLTLFQVPLISSTASSGVLTPISYIYSTMLPIIFFFFCYTLGNRKRDDNLPLCIAFGFCLLQALVSVILYNVNFSSIAHSEPQEILPSLIFEGLVIVASFFGAIFYSIKASGTEITLKKIEQGIISFPTKLFSWSNLVLGSYGVLSVLIFSLTVDKISPENNFLQNLMKIALCITRYDTLLVPSTFAAATIITISKQKKRYIAISWIGSIALSLTYVILYMIN